MAPDFDRAIEKLKERKNDMERYAYIMRRVYDADVSSDAEFQRTFNAFYRVRRNEAWRKRFYDLFEECKNKEDLSFEYILRSLYSLTGNIEASFSSKMLATLNAQMPIWDSIVLSRLQIKPTTSTDKEMRILDAIEIYKNIAYRYDGFLQADKAQEVLDKFDEAFPEYENFSEIKKIDFLLWGDKDAEPLLGSRVRIEGYIDLPSIVPCEEFADKFLAFIESNYWHFDGSISEIDE